MDSQNLGWIKLWRKLEDNPIFKNPRLLQLWIYCLFKANHRKNKAMIGFQEIPLTPGQFITGRYSLAKDLGLKPRSTRSSWNWLKILESMRFLTIKSTNKYSIVSINNWHTYQGNEMEDYQQPYQRDTIKIPSKYHQNTTDKNDKNVKNDKKKDLVRKNSNPQIKEFIDFAFLKTEEITKTALVIKRTNEPPLVKHLLGTIKLDRLKLLWEYFITEDFEDEWLEKTGKTITSFNSKINMLNQNYNGWLAKQRYERSK